MSKQRFLVTISHYDGRPIETYVHTDEDNMDTDGLFWNLRMLVDPSKDVNVQYLGPVKKPSKLIALKQIG